MMSRAGHLTQPLLQGLSRICNFQLKLQTGNKLLSVLTAARDKDIACHSLVG